MSDRINIAENIPLAGFTTFKIGGEARFFVEAKTEDEVVCALEFARKNNLEVFVLGGGSNVLIADTGFSGLVLKINLKGIFEKSENDIVLVTANAGEDWDGFVEYCVSRNLAGIECLSGIPGLVGGTPIQNVGAYGQEVSETILGVRVYDRELLRILELENKDCDFGYRKSIFNTSKKDRYVVLSVTYCLRENGSPKIAYRELENRFQGERPTLLEVRSFVCALRESKGMLVRQGGFDSQSAGSFFKNPIVDSEDFDSVEKKAVEMLVGSVPRFVVDEESSKIPAAWLIEKAGFAKGFRRGNAGLSDKHTLALTNRGDCSAQELLELKSEIQEKVKKTFGIDLIPEPNFVGFGD